MIVSCTNSTHYLYRVNVPGPEPPLAEFRGHMGRNFYVTAALSRDGQYLASGSVDHDAYVWQVRHRMPMCGRNEDDFTN